MPLSRSGWVLATLASLSVWLIAPDAGAACADDPGPDFPQALLGLASLTPARRLAAGCCWSSPLSQLRGASPVVARSPQRSCGALCSSARSAPSPWHPHTQIAELSPSRPCTRTRSTACACPIAPPIAGSTDAVVVRPGDTLWAIAARSLPARIQRRRHRRGVCRLVRHQPRRDRRRPRPDPPSATPHPPTSSTTRTRHEDSHRSCPSPSSGRPSPAWSSRRRTDTAAVSRDDAGASGSGRARRRQSRCAIGRRDSCRRSSRCCPASGPYVRWGRGWRPTSTSSSAHGSPSTPVLRGDRPLPAAPGSCRCTSRWCTTRRPRSPAAWCIADAPAPSPYDWSSRPLTAATRSGAAQPSPGPEQPQPGRRPQPCPSEARQ